MKKTRIGFIDIENRNLLLDLVSFFSTEWICFMDTDERFDKRFDNFGSVENDIKTDNILFNYVNIWNNYDYYNSNYPYSKKGIIEKLRMFRNIGHAQIFTYKNRVHFDVVPYKQNIKRGEVLFKHYGMASIILRKEKYNFYQKEDIAKDQTNYEHMLNDNPALLDVNDIVCIDGNFYNLKE